MWHDLLVALALVLVIEGIFPFINPEGLRKTLLMMARMTDQQLRFAGLTSMTVGIIVLYIVK